MQSQRRTGRYATALFSWLIVACRADDATPESHASMRPELCERAGEDAVRDVFCNEAEPPITGLYDLQVRLGLQNTLHTDGVTYYNSPILLSHSTSLFGHAVSPLNPRAFLVGSNVVLTFQRGEQRLELAAQARDRERFNLYLLTFTQACNDAADGCNSADRFSARLEADWRSVELHDDEELKNTPFDCRQCHQRGIENQRLLMRELRSPWTHFFDAPQNSTAGFPGVRGTDLALDYLRAHGAEPYAGIDVANYPQIAPFALERIVGHDQPLVFDTELIQAERWPMQQNGGFADAPQPSPTWENSYQAFKRGEQLALPYEAERITDPDKQQQLTAAYRSFLDGETAELPDLSDVFPDDPRLRARLGLQTEPDATPVEALIQACGSCHNLVLDQSLSRARFNIDLSRLDDSELDTAIERISRPRSEPGCMPPPDARQLEPSARERLLDYLRREARGGRAVEALEHASALGMAGSR